MVAAKGNGFVFLKLRSPCGPVSYLFKIKTLLNTFRQMGVFLALVARAAARVDSLLITGTSLGKVSLLMTQVAISVSVNFFFDGTP